LIASLMGGAALVALSSVAPACVRTGSTLPVPPGEAAVRSGITAYDVLAVDAHHVRVGLFGLLSGELSVEVYGGAASHHLVLVGRTAFDLKTSRHKIAIDDGTKHITLSPPQLNRREDRPRRLFSTTSPGLT
jgi:hypothetical protein